MPALLPPVPLIELIVPVYNEGPQIAAHLATILAQAGGQAADGQGTRYRLQLLVIDDGSNDDTAAALARFCACEPRARCLSFTRNFGKEAAICAGFEHVSDAAAAAVILDADLQHPPALVPAMVALWQSGYPVVEACKSSRGRETFARRLFAAGFYRLFQRLAGFDLSNQSDFKLLDRTVIESYRKLPERDRFFRGLIPWLGHERAQVRFDVPARTGGVSRWSRLRLLRYAIDNLTAFSAAPLQLIIGAGLLGLVVGGIFGALALLQKLQGQAVDGFTTVILLLVFFSSTLMLSLGIIGQYLARIYEELKQRPRYVLRPTETTAVRSGAPEQP